MKLNKKGFTLIELLAVIVILAIIALIATPVVMNTISSAQEKTKLRSVENYASAFENAYYEYMLNNNGAEPTDLTKLTVTTNGEQVICTVNKGNDNKLKFTNCTVGTDTETKYHITDNGAAAVGAQPAA